MGSINAARLINDLVSTPEGFEKLQKEDSYLTKYVSYFYYILDCNGLKRTYAIPIEGIIGLARDPRKCWDLTSDEYTDSKDFLIPMSQAGHSIFIRNLPRSKNFLFDAGASYYLDKYDTSMKWLVDTYDRMGTRFDRLIAWEEKSMNVSKAAEGLPQWLRSGFEFYNHGINVHSMSPHNPINFIKKHCKKNDFVVFKLDINSKESETDLITQLFTDRKAMELIDDFYYEEHFYNMAMLKDGWLRYRSTLEDYYVLAVAQRERGMRMHYWP